MQTTAHPLPCEEVPGYNAFADIRFLGSSVTRPLVVTGSLGHWVTGSLWVTVGHYYGTRVYLGPVSPHCLRGG